MDTVENQLPELWRVAVLSAPDDMHALADVLAGKLSLHRTDARVHAHRAPGLLPDRLPQTAANDLVAAIDGLGVRAFAIRDQDLPNVDHPLAIHHGRCEANGFAVLNLCEKTQSCVPWNNLEVISAGSIPLHKIAHPPVALRTALSAAPHPPEDDEVEQTHGPALLLIASTPPRVIRIDHDEFNYEYLGEEMVTSASANFRCLLRDLHRLAPNAVVTPSTRALLKHDAHHKYAFDSWEDLKREAEFRWVCLRAVEAGFAVPTRTA